MQSLHGKIKALRSVSLVEGNETLVGTGRRRSIWRQWIRRDVSSMAENVARGWIDGR